MKTGGRTWWKVVVGGALVLLNAEHLLFPATRNLQPSNSDQAFGMLLANIVILMVGVWLLVSGLRRKAES